MARLDEAPILDAGTTPIPGGDPCGVDPADDEDYIFVTGEIGKLDRLDAEEPDWFRIEQGGLNLLRSTAKDLEIASIVGVALFKQYGYAGLAAALGLLRGLVTTFWDGMYPARPRRRKARVEAMTLRFTDGGWFSENKPKPDDFDALDLCVTRIGELEAALTEKMPDTPPDFGKFTTGLKAHAGQRPKPEAAPPPPPAPEAGAAPPAAAPAAPTAGGFAAGEIADVGSARSTILSAVSFIRKNDPSDPLPYAVARTLKWARIVLPATEAAKTQIPVPQGNALEALEHQMNNNLFEHLLNNAEASFRSGDPLWLDLQRYVCAAMAGLGPEFESARQIVMTLTAGLVNRLGSGLFDLRFSNGTPLCSGETKMWIDAEVVSAPGGGGGPNGAVDEKLAEASDKARQLAGSGKLKEALAELQQGLAACGQRRDQFLWKATIAQLCCDAKKYAVAASLGQECRDAIRRYQIDEWEPSLAVSVARTLYQCRKALIAGEQEPAQEALQGVREAFAWLCQLDPGAALAAE